MTSSLMLKAASDLTVDRRPIAFVDLEGFKGHSYPDALLSVLLSTFREFARWLQTAAVHPASKTTFWKRLFGAKPQRAAFDKQAVAKLLERVSAQISELEGQLHATDDAEIRVESENVHDTERHNGAKVAVAFNGVGGEVGRRSYGRDSSGTRTTEELKRNKVDFLHRHIITYQGIFRDMAELSQGPAYLFLDDLYYIRRSDQSDLIDYFHRIVKGSNVWLKVGTIRHRSDWYRHSDPPIGVKLGDDVDEIDLDLTLERYQTTKKFLVSVLQSIADEVRIHNVKHYISDTGLDRLVLASGGVARDFLSLFRISMQVGRERGGGARGDRIAAEDVNQAAGQVEGPKREELKRDTFDERGRIEGAFNEIRSFCIERAKSNCFLREKDLNDDASAMIDELVDLRLLHLVQSRVTIPGKPGKIYVAYLLDLGQYSGERKRRGLDMIPFWEGKGKEQLRRVSLVYE
jgi:hypothetical protein